MSRCTLANRRAPGLAGAGTATTNSRNNLVLPGNRENFALLANWRVDHHSRRKSVLERGLITAVLSTATIGLRPVADQHGRANRPAIQSRRSPRNNGRPTNRILERVFVPLMPIAVEWRSGHQATSAVIDRLIVASGQSFVTPVDNCIDHASIACLCDNQLRSESS